MTKPLRLPTENEVHVWTAQVPEYSHLVADLASLLSPDETQTARRFIYSVDRVRYIIAHGVLRRLLSEYLSVLPRSLEFVSDKFGKPSLSSNQGRPLLNFNISHSGEIILYGITLNRRVGVDIEAIRADIDVLDLARSQFSRGEFDSLVTTPLLERSAAFFRCWTRKEAYLKARGEGLGYPLDRFTVSLEVIEQPKLLWVEDDPDADSKWSMFHLHPPLGYAATAVVEGQSISLVALPAKFFD